MKKYTKSLIALLGFALNVLNVIYANDPRVTAAISLATAFGVYQFPNKPLKSQR